MRAVRREKPPAVVVKTEERFLSPTSPPRVSVATVVCSPLEASPETLEDVSRALFCIARLWPRLRTPSSTEVRPVKELDPVRICVPEPALSRFRFVPPMLPEKVKLALLLMVRVPEPLPVLWICWDLRLTAAFCKPATVWLKLLRSKRVKRPEPPPATPLRVRTVAEGSALSLPSLTMRLASLSEGLRVVLPA